MVDPFTLYAGISAMNGVVSIINSSSNRVHQYKLQKKRALTDQYLKNEDFISRKTFEKTGFFYTPGKFLETIYPTAEKPIVLFDTRIYNHYYGNKLDFPINPMISLVSEFKSVNTNLFNDKFKILSYSAEFKSEVEVLGFYNREFKDVSAVIVYGDFDGNKLRIKTVYNGITGNQFKILSGNEYKIDEATVNSVEICSMQYDLVYKQFLNDDGENKQSSSDKIDSKVKIESAINIVSNTSLSALMECYLCLEDSQYKIVSLDLDSRMRVLGEGNKSDAFELASNIKMAETREKFLNFISSSRGKLHRLYSTTDVSSPKNKFNMYSADKLKNDFNRKLKDVLNQQKKPTILVFGQVGVGKTTLIQKILGDDVVPNDAISSYKPGTKSFVEYRNDYLTLVDSMGFEPGMTIDDFKIGIKSKVRELQTDSDIKNHIHLSWYCIQGSSARITDTDLKLIKDVLSSDRTIVVITKSDITKDSQLSDMMNYLVESGIKRDRIVSVNETEEIGQRKLVDLSTEILPDAYKASFISKQKLNLDKKREYARTIIIKASTRASVLGLIPYVDWVGILPLQLGMAANLATNYGFDPTEIDRKLFGAGFATTIIGSLGANLVFDIINPIFGAVAGSINAKATTGSLGVFINDYFVSLHEAIQHGRGIDSVKPLNITVDKLKESAEIFKKVSPDWFKA